MALTKNEKESIKEQLSKGKSLQEILTAQFPDKTISIIRGYSPEYIDDLHFYDGFTKGAYFSAYRAVREMAKARRESKEAMENVEVKVGQKEDYIIKYHLIKTNANALLNKELTDKNGKIVDAFDIAMAYESLEKQLK